MSQCRLSRFGSHSIEIFNRLSCANCYKLLLYVFDGREWDFNVTDDGYLISDYNNLTLDSTNKNHIQLIKNTMNNLEYDKWSSCCNEAKNCCKYQINHFNSTNYFNTSLKCEPIWDGWSCHSVTLANQLSKVKCPSHFVADTCNTILDHVYFKCESNGEWYRNNYGEWADYGSCMRSILPIKERLINVNIICQSVSLFFLIIGLIIFFSYNQLRVNRIILHKNFFISLILNSLFQIIWEWAIMKMNLYNSDKYIDSNHLGCIIINLIVQYTRSTNYFWMLCESLYLHQLLINVFKEQSNFFMFHLIGWGIPFIICSLYALASYIYQNHSCWTRNISLIYIINIPNIITIILNFLFLINIIRILYKKLTAENTNEPHQYRKAVKATIILVPLFGLHLILSPYVMCDSAPGSEIHNFLNRLVESLQGFVVALIYCFFNSEVLCLLKRTFFKFEIIRWETRKRNSKENQYWEDTCDYDLDETDVTSLSKVKKSLIKKISSFELLKKKANNDYNNSNKNGNYNDELINLNTDLVANKDNNLESIF